MTRFEKKNRELTGALEKSHQRIKELAEKLVLLQKQNRDLQRNISVNRNTSRANHQKLQINAGLHFKMEQAIKGNDITARKNRKELSELKKQTRLAGRSLTTGDMTVFGRSTTGSLALGKRQTFRGPFFDP